LDAFSHVNQVGRPLSAIKSIRFKLKMNARFKAYHTSWSHDWLAEFEYAGCGLPDAVGFG
jgi:hypothetical protein